MDKNKLEYIMYYTNDIKLPEFNNSDELNYNLVEIKKESDMYLNQFGAFIKLQQNDKLCVIDNALVIQKLSPWRYFERKYNKQNRKTLSIYLDLQINLYSNFLYNIINLFSVNKNDKELYNISVKHYDFIQLSLPKLISLRNIYNLKDHAYELRISLEQWCSKLTKFKMMFIELISNKR